MKFPVLLLLITIFCVSILVVTNTQPYKPDTKTLVAQKFDGPREFEAFHRSIRTPDDAEGPQYTPGYVVREFQKAKAFVQARTQSNGVLEWTERGPSNVPGRIRGLIVDPDDPEKNTWYAGSAGGGVWKTINGGLSWKLITPNLPNLATTVLAMTPSNPNIIYLGTGEGFFNVDRIRGNGMYKSIDRGQTWSYLSTTSGFSDVNRAIVSPTNPSIVIVATNEGIYRSEDGGSSWTQVSNLPTIQDLKSKPGNFNIQYATQNGVGVLKSTDGGITWQLSSTGMNVSGRIEIAVSPVLTNRIFASAQSTETGISSALYVSNNEGTSWELMNVALSGPIEFLGGQGWYDNAIACDPFNPDIVYVGGVNLFRVKITSGTSTQSSYSIQESGSQNFITLINFVSASHGNFQVGSAANTTSVEIRFGQGKSQKAHRFLVPEGSTSGVPDANYSYADYVTVPFEVWDITNNRQLMVSFRDQDRNGEFNLLHYNVTGGSLAQSREYIYINNTNYAPNPNPGITVSGGHIHQQMYFFWPVLADGKTWPENIVESQLRFVASALPLLNTETITSSDAYNQYDGKNRFTNYGTDFHPDQHNLVMIPMSTSTYKILVANDGGIFISNTSATPAIGQGDWTMRGRTLNTSQFYGADKRPGFDEYIGGMQDNGTWKSNAGTTATASSNYIFNLGGDGFEVIWHNLDDQKIIGGSQGNVFSRSLNGGASWSNATSGLSGVHPFISKLASSRDNPDVLFTLSSNGVFRSKNFGQNWEQISIAENWGGTSSLMDVEVSRANATIVWAGSGMTNGGSTRNLHVSTNGGNSFSPANNYTLVTLGNITKLASHPYEANTAYALFSFSGKPKILRTTNLGQSWEDISGFETSNVSTNGFPDVAVYCLYVRPDNPEILWAGTEIGIVESLDNGVTWNLINDFPSVSVWDMKGQDNQIVIATHGRGIWTATVEAPQITVLSPEILNFGTSPKKDLFLTLKINEVFDSVEIYETDTRLGVIKPAPIAETVVKISNLSAGIKNIKLVSYRGTAPYHSKTYSIEHLDLLEVRNQFSTYFTTGSNLLLKAFSILPLPGSASGERSILQTNHPYSTNSSNLMIIRHPIKIENTLPVLQYEDIAILEPGVEGAAFGTVGFKDYVVVEATKNGLDWIPLTDGYDARFNSQWLTVYNGNGLVNKSMFVNHEINLTDKFTVGDTVLIRYRLFSDAAITSWGWAINYITVQQLPTGVERNISTSRRLSLYPNPAKEKVTLEYELERASEISIHIIDNIGRTVLTQNPGKKESGKHVHTFNLNNLGAGNYIVVVKARSGELKGKLILRN